MRIAVVALYCLVSIAASPQALTSAADGNPCTSAISGPSDPNYAPAERNPLGGLTFNAEQWHLYDCIPQSAPVATDPENASGMSVNKAWAAFGMGRSDVLVAYIEGGVNWRINRARIFGARLISIAASFPLRKMRPALPCPAIRRAVCNRTGTTTSTVMAHSPSTTMPTILASGIRCSIPRRAESLRRI